MRWWVASGSGVLLLLLLIHIDANILLPILARRSAVLPLITKAKATSLVGCSVSCLGCRHILLLIMWWLSAATSRPARLSAMITLSSVIACAHVPETASFVTGTASTCLVRMVASIRRGGVAGARTELRIGRGHLPLAHLIILILPSCLTSMMSANCTNRSSKK